MAEEYAANRINMAFIDKTDLNRYLEDNTTDQITDSDDALVTEVISDAEDRIREKISPRYDLDTEFAKTGANRNRSLMKHCINLSIYYLFQRLYLNVIPEGRGIAYEEAEKWLDDVYMGKLNVALATNDEDAQQGWPLRWGSDTKKGNQTY